MFRALLFHHQGPKQAGVDVLIIIVILKKGVYLLVYIVTNGKLCTEWKM